MDSIKKAGYKYLIMKLYKSFEQTKNGSYIPVFLSGRTMESRYNPQRDAENLYNSINKESKFFLVLGVGSGIFLNLLSEKNPDAKIIAFEMYREDIDFLSQGEDIKKTLNNPSIIFSDFENLESRLMQNYLPAKYGNLEIIEQRAWINEINEKKDSIYYVIKKALGIISADYSVQAHFGKIWTSNILNNAKLAENHFHNYLEDISSESLKKTAVIVAAGPTLDKKIENFSDENQKDFFFIATDTAASSLIKRRIIPDIIVSIDGQSVSYNHFLSRNNKDITKEEKTAPLFAFDLSANSSAAKHFCEAQNKVMFFCSGHPLSSALNASNNSILPVFFSGAGTVTITALDMAVKSGFKKILILGADFAYSEGKAYTRGTYLDSLYNKQSSKLNETEEIYSKLMFRTELKSITEGIKTTQVLEAYRYSLEKYLTDNNLLFSKINDIYEIENKADKRTNIFLTNENCSFSLSNFYKKLENAQIEELEPLLLPYVAWLRNKEKYINIQYNKLLKLALDSIVRYNI